MVRAKLQYYYTFKVANDGSETGQVIVECHKWEELSGEHADTYRVKPGVEWMGCSCPAYRHCKHQKCVQETIETGKFRELWKWRWDEKHGWQELKDITPIEEMQL